MKNLIEFLIQFLGQNLNGVIGIAVAGFIATYIGKGVAKLVGLVVKSKIAKLIIKFVPEGIGLGDLLKGEKPNSERLLRAVMRVQTLILKAFPEFTRPYIDKMIDENAIVKEIERALSERVLEKNTVRP